MTSVSNLNQGFISPARLQQWKRDQELQPRMATNEFGQTIPSSPPSAFRPFPQQQQMPEMRRTMSGQVAPTQPPTHTRTTSAFSLFSRKAQTMDTSKDTPPLHKQSASVAEAPRPHNVLIRRTSNPRTDPTSPNNNGVSQPQQPLSPPPTSQPQTPMTPSTPSSASASKPPPQLHPEIRSIVQLTGAHAQKVYFSGPMVRRVERQPDGQKPTKDEGWRNVWGQLGGTTLSLWDMKDIEEASKQGRQVPPSYINVTDAFVQVVGGLTTPGTPESPPQTYVNVFSVNTAGLNLLLFSCPSTQALISWTAALRLAAWEKSRLEEMYTAHLIRIMLNDGRETRSPLVRGKMEGWVRIRVAGQTDWKKLWMVVSSGTAQHDNGVTSPSEKRPASPNAPRKNRISQLFSRDQSPPQSAVPSKPVIQAFISPKPKDKKKALLTFQDVSQAFAVYPERPELISRSTLMKLEGIFGEEEMAGSMRNREAWLLVMPELEANNTRASEMLKWLIAIHDAFELYGRPRIYSWDPRDPQSTMFAYPIGPNRDLLFLDRELAETLDPRDDRTSSIRRQLRQVLWQRMRGSPPTGSDKAQPPVPLGDRPPMLPPLPSMQEEPNQAMGSGLRFTSQSPSGAPQIAMQIPPLDFERPAETLPQQSSPEPRQESAARALTPITERSNPPDSRSLSGDTNNNSQRPSLQYSPPAAMLQSPHSPPAAVPQAAYSAPAPPPPSKSPELEQDSLYGGRITTSPIPTSPPGDVRTFGLRPSEEPHFVVASRPASKQGQYGSPKPASAVPAGTESTGSQPPSSPPAEHSGSSTPSSPPPSHSPPQQHQKTPSPTPASPIPSPHSPISHVSQAPPTFFNPPPPVHSPRATSPVSVLTSPFSVRESYQGPVSSRFSVLTSPHSIAPSRGQSYVAQQPSTSSDTPSSPAVSHKDNAPPPSPAHSSMASSTMQPIQRRELRDEPPEESVLGKEAGALYYMRHIDGDAPPPSGLRRPPPPPATDEDEDDDGSSDSPSIYTPPATTNVNPLNIRKSPSPPPFPPSKASSIVYPGRPTPAALDSVLPVSPNPSTFSPTTSPTSPISGGSRPAEPPSRYGSVAKPSGARAAPGNKISSAGAPGLASVARRDEQSSSLQQQPPPSSSSPPSSVQPTLSEAVEEVEEEAEHQNQGMATQHTELSYANDVPRAEAGYDDTADALAALNFLDQEEIPPPAAAPKKTGLPPSPHPPHVVEPSSETLSDSSHHNAHQRSSFAPSKSAAERKAKSQAQQAALQAAAHKPGRANGKAKGRAREAGAWGESSDEEEEEEEEDEDEEADSDEELPPRHRAQQNMGAPNAARAGYPTTPSMQSGLGQDMTAYGQGRRPRDLPQVPGQGPLGGPDDYMNQPQPRRMMQDRHTLYPNEGPRRQASPLQQMTRPLTENAQYHLPQAPPPNPHQNMWSQVLEPGAKVNPQQRETFVQIEPPSQTMTKAFTPHGLLSAGLQDKQDRSAKRQEELARETGASLINVPNKPPPPQTGLLGAVAAHEREKKREGGLGATLTEREREKRMAEERQRKLDDFQRMQLDQMQQGGSMYGGMGYPGFNPMMNPMMANPMMMGMNPMMTGAGWGGFPGMMNPQQMFAAQQAAAQAYQQAMMAFSTAGSQVGGEGSGQAPLNPMMTGGSMFDPRMSMMGMMNPMAMGGMGMGGGMGGGMSPGMNPMGMGGMGMQMTGGGGSPFDGRFSAGFDGGSGPGTPAEAAGASSGQRPYSSQNSSANGRGSPAVPKATESTDDLPRPHAQ